MSRLEALQQELSARLAEHGVSSSGAGVFTIGSQPPKRGPLLPVDSGGPRTAARIFLPVCFNDGAAVPVSLFVDFCIELLGSCTDGATPSEVEGFWLKANHCYFDRSIAFDINCFDLSALWKICEAYRERTSQKALYLETDRGRRVDLVTEEAGCPFELNSASATPAATEAASHGGTLTAARFSRQGMRHYGPVVYADSKTAEVMERAEKFARSTGTVLITGETGSGKELIAEAIHVRSGRQGPLVRLNAAAQPETLIESAMFGHELGAFTGAVRRQVGVFEKADKGTLFLDEIGDISPTMQVRLLRVLEEGSFERVGGAHPIKVDVRVVAATNRDLKALVEQGRFREDLYYRLQQLPIRLPPLRDRIRDIPVLVCHLLQQSGVTKETRDALTPDAEAAILGHRWPGNVRELRNAIGRAVALAGGRVIDVQHLELEASSQAGRSPGRRSPGPRKKPIDIEEALRLRARGLTMDEVAGVFEVSRAQLYKRLGEAGVSLSSRETISRRPAIRDTDSLT